MSEAGREKRADTPPEITTKELLAYMDNMLNSLKKLAANINKDLLSHLIQLAEIEAKFQSDHADENPL